MEKHIPTFFNGNKFMGIREVMGSYFIPKKLSQYVEAIFEYQL